MNLKLIHTMIIAALAIGFCLPGTWEQLEKVIPGVKTSTETNGEDEVFKGLIDKDPIIRRRAKQ